MTKSPAIHLVASNDRFGWSRTGCGKQGVGAPGRDHYLTGSGGHFLAVETARLDEATCSICRQRVDLAAGGQDDVSKST